MKHPQISVASLPEEVHKMIINMSSVNETIRAKSVDKFAKYIEDPVKCKKVMNPSKLMHIWYGLQAAMMNQAEPLRQEELADKIGNLVLKLNRDKYVLKFFEIGIITLARDWNKINQYQIDKFLKLFRILLRKVLQYCVQRRWQLSSALCDMLERVIILPADQRHDFPAGPKTHLADILMEELAKTQIIDTRLDFKILRKFLVPYMKVLTINKEKVYRKAVYEGIFVYLCRQSDAGIAAFADLGEKEVPEEELRRLKEESAEYMARRRTRRGKAKPRKLNEMEEAMKKMVEEEEHLREEDDASEGGSDGEFDEEFDKELSDLEEEEEEEVEDAEEEEEEEQPADYGEVELDPRAGSVNVVLPQLPVDWAELGAWVGEASQLSQLNKAQRQKLEALHRLVADAAGGVFVSHHPLVEPRRLEEEDVDQAMVEQALLRRQKFEAEEVARFKPGAYHPAEKARLTAEHDRTQVKRVQALLRGEDKQRKQAKQEERKRYQEKRAARKLLRLGQATQRIRRGMERRQTRTADARADKKRRWQQLEQEEVDRREGALRELQEATQRVFKKARRQ